MKNRILKAFISVVLCFTVLAQLTVHCFAAPITGRTYVKEIYLGYGKDDESAKQALKDKGYKVIDHNINEGADDTFSAKRSVYIGYKTTLDPDEAITDIKLMNMKGGYSVQDYAMLLEQQKTNIRAFINNFIVAINEYRENYNKGQERAKAAYEMLNLMYDDDTEQTLGDLFLEKIREEYTDEEFEKLSKEEQNATADMTTILMQSSATAVLAIEQIIAIATDAGDTCWSERYMDIQTYESMVDELVDNEDLTPSKAMSKLASMYDSDAKVIASKAEEYIEYLKIYTESGITFASTEDEIEAYNAANDSFNVTEWFALATQYEMLNSLVDEDGVSLYDILVSGDYDITGTERYMLYPLVSVLTEGQRACLDFVSLYQLVSMGINGDDALCGAMDSVQFEKKDCVVSIYDGVDRGIFSDEVALTGAAYSFQNSTGKDPSLNWFNNGLSDTTIILYMFFGVSLVATIGTFVSSAILNSMYQKATRALGDGFDDAMCDSAASAIEDGFEAIEAENEGMNRALSEMISARDEAIFGIGETRVMSQVFKYIGVGMTVVSIVLLGFSLYNTYKDLKEYYKTEYTPIPGYMVNQGVNSQYEMVYTYYNAVLCNRQDAQMMTEETKVLKGYGDINGDVGKQWVAMYTTTDKAAGDPITADFVVQYADSSIPSGKTALSMFDEMVAQNLTNNQSGYTFDDEKGGIYLFYSTDSHAFAGSVFTTGIYALIAGGALIICAVAVNLIIKKRKSGKEKNNA